MGVKMLEVTQKVGSQEGKDSREENVDSMQWMFKLFQLCSKLSESKVPRGHQFLLLLIKINITCLCELFSFDLLGNKLNMHCYSEAK